MVESSVLLRQYVQTHDGQAFAELARRHAGLVYGVCMRILGDREQAAEAAQETFFQLVRSAGSITGSISGWLHCVATRKAIDFLRKDSLRRSVESEYIDSKPRAVKEWKDLSLHVDEALNLLAEGNGETRVLAGGTDLVAWLREEAIAPDLVVDIKRIGGLHQIEDLGNAVSIGALVTFSDLLQSRLVRDQLPMLHEVAGTVGSTGIRNRATLIGNICSAVPSADAGPALLAYEADVEIVKEDGARRISISDWFLGPRRTALGHAEMATRVHIPVPEGGHGAVYARLSRYPGDRISIRGPYGAD